MSFPGPSSLQYRDTLVLCDGPSDDVGVVRGLRQEKIPVKVVARRDDDDAIRDVALAESNCVTVTDCHTVSGLERRVVVGLGEVDVNRLYAMSRCSAQLIWVRRQPLEDEGYAKATASRDELRDDKGHGEPWVLSPLSHPASSGNGRESSPHDRPASSGNSRESSPHERPASSENSRESVSYTHLTLPTRRTV